MKRRCKKKRPNDWHHSKREEKMEDQSIINVGNLGIYKDSAGPELIRANSREMSNVNTMGPMLTNWISEVPR